MRTERKVSFMEKEQATMAVQSMEAAPIAGAENDREKTMTVLLEGMSAEQADEAVGEEITTEAEGGGALAQDPDVAADTAVISEEAEVPAQNSTDVGEGEPATLDDDGESEISGGESASDGKQARNFRGRWDHLNEQERRVVELTTKRGLTLGEAYRAVYGVEALPALNGEAEGQDEAGEPKREAGQSQSTNQFQRSMQNTNPTEPVRTTEAPQAQAPVSARPAGAIPRRSVRPVPAGGSPVEAPATTLERRVAGVRSTGEMLELMREIGTPFEALLKR